MYSGEHKLFKLYNEEVARRVEDSEVEGVLVLYVFKAIMYVFK